MNEKYKSEYERFKQDIELGLYDNSAVAVVYQFGRLGGFLELTDFTELELINEDNKINELYACWEKRHQRRKLK